MDLQTRALVEELCSSKAVADSRIIVHVHFWVRTLQLDMDRRKVF
jgi:hypothetical protein